MSTMGIPAISGEQMKEVDRLMIDVFHIELVQMMENAGRNLAILSRDFFFDGDVFRKRVIVCAGSGGNGGGGLVAARHLFNWGGEVTVFLAKSEDRFHGVPGHQLDILHEMKVPVTHGKEIMELPEPDLILDAIIGYSLHGAPRGKAARMIEATNTYKMRGVPVLSLDIPSGLDSTTGQVYQPCISTTATMTLALPKTGLMVERARENVGALYLADISVPRELYKAMGLSVPMIFREKEIIRLY